jgi:hypothetical protein
VYWPAGPDSESDPVGGKLSTLPPQSPPGRPPVSVQFDAFDADQEALNVSPATTVPGKNVIVGVGGGGGSTVRVSLLDVAAMVSGSRAVEQYSHT